MDADSASVERVDRLQDAVGVLQFAAVGDAVGEEDDFVETRGRLDGLAAYSEQAECTLEGVVDVGIGLRFLVRQVQRDAAGGRSSFSRLTIFMALDTESGQATLECRRTVRNRDLESDRVTVPMTAEGSASLDARIEAWFLEFAEAYFGVRLAA